MDELPSTQESTGPGTTQEAAASLQGPDPAQNGHGSGQPPEVHAPTQPVDGDGGGDADLETRPDNVEPTVAFDRTDADPDPVNPDATTLADPAALAGPTEPTPRIGPYVLVKSLGRGSQGGVWLAIRFDGTHRRVALKVGASEWFEAESRDRLLKEFTRADKVIHPAILPVFDYGVDDITGRAYMAMRLVEGYTLGQVIVQRRQHLARQTPEELHRLAILNDALYLSAIVSLTKRIAEALHQAHRVRIIHRDIKPSNILLDHDGASYLSDFGLAQDLERSTSWGADLAGTLPYMPPERFTGRRVEFEERCDVYSLGVTLYEAVTLHRPHEPKGDKSPNSWTTYWRNEDAPRPPESFRPGLPRDLEAVILKAIDPIPSGRYASAQEFADELACIERDEPVKARPPGLLRKAGRHLARYRRALVIVGLALMVVMLSGTLLAWSRYNRTRAAALHGEAEQLIADGDFDRARDVLVRAQALDPGSPENERIGGELLRANFEQMRDSIDSEDPARTFALLELHRSLGGRDTIARLDLPRTLGLRSVVLASEPPGAMVTFHPVRPDRRPRFVKPLIAARAGSIADPVLIERVPPGPYWLTAVDPVTSAFLERPYQVERAGRQGVGETVPVLRLSAAPPAGMARIEGGTLMMGDNTRPLARTPDGKGVQGFLMTPEYPAHPIEVPEFFLDATEVTNADFARFLEESHRDDWRKELWPETGKFPKDQGAWPVTMVRPEMASEYAAWRGCRLPTEAELEWAGRGKDGRLVPPGVPQGWKPEGPSWKTLHAVRSEPIDRIEAGDVSIFGLYGNAGEITLFRFRPYPNPQNFRPRDDSWVAFVIRSGLFPNWRTNGVFLLGYHKRASLLSERPHALVGFRCARSLRPWAQTPSIPIPSSE